MSCSAQEYVDAHNNACDKLGISIQDRVGPTVEQAAKMLESGWCVRPGEPYGQFSLRVKNYVYSTKLITATQSYGAEQSIRVNLRMLAQMQQYAPRTRQSFQSLIFGLDMGPSSGIKTSVIVYMDGGLLVMGARTRDEYLLAISHLLRILVESKMFKARDIYVAPETIINTVSSGTLPEDVSTKTLQGKFPSLVNLRKLRFSGASITIWPSGPDIQCDKIVGLAFDSKKFVMIGYRLKEECALALYIFIYMLWSSRVITRKRRRLGFAENG
jgi:TATA-box binding protein (TBP) (component of TFIID and TFIIIB)